MLSHIKRPQLAALGVYQRCFAWLWLKLESKDFDILTKLQHSKQQEEGFKASEVPPKVEKLQLLSMLEIIHFLLFLMLYRYQ